VKPVRLSVEAVEELAEAATWYDARQRGLGAKFIDEFERALVSIGSRPASFPRLRDVSPDMGIRRIMLARFPYGLVFLELDVEIRVLAVAHAKRDPGFWLNRIEPS